MFVSVKRTVEKRRQQGMAFNLRSQGLVADRGLAIGQDTRAERKQKQKRFGLFELCSARTISIYKMPMKGHREFMIG